MRDDAFVKTVTAPGFEVCISTDLGVLATHLAEHLPSSEDPFVSELVVVPSVGVRRWLEQRLAVALGVSANTRFVFPGAFARELRMQAFGDAIGRWEIRSLTGQIFALLSEPDLAVELGVPLSRGALMVRARYIADLFDRYGMHRTDMVTQWAHGVDVDGHGSPLAAAQLWQPTLWRALCSKLGPAPAERTRKWLAEFPDVEGQPSVIHTFGLSALSADVLALLGALSRQRRVLVHAIASSRADAERQIAWGRELAERASGRRPNDVGPTNANELLTAWNEVQRHGLVHLGEHALDNVVFLDSTTQRTDTPDTLLATMQHQITHDEVFHEGAKLDDSISFHACSGEARQLEVLRDVILGLLNTSEVEESDVLVICPNLDRFAHLIEPIFGPSAAHDQPIDSEAQLPALRYVVNHQPFTGAAPLFEGVLELLSLVDGRVPHSRLVSFLSLEVVRRKFDMLSDDRLGLGVSWLSRSQLRWGLTGEHRSGHSPLPEQFRTHTLQTTRESILGGVAVPDDQALPESGYATGVDLSDVDLAGEVGAFAEAVMIGHRELVAAPVASMTEWADRIRTVAGSLFETEATATWQWTQLDHTLATLIGSIPGSARLNIADVAEALRGAISHRLGRRSFGTGAVVIDGPQALRSVPHEVVCLLGFDSDAIPLGGHTADDLIAAAPVPGDRDRRADGRQQLLDAILAAGSRVVVTWDGHNIYTNAAIPPATALQELIDAAVVVSGADDEKNLVYRHPRFSHDERHFNGSSDTVASFDDLARVAAQARREQRSRRRLFPTPIPVPASARYSVNELRSSLVTPTAVFARETLGVIFPPEQQRPVDLLPVELNPLDRWHLGQDLLHAGLQQVDLETWTTSAQERGTLPPGQIGQEEAAKLHEGVGRIARALAVSFNASGPELLAEIQTQTLPLRVEVDHPTHGRIDVVGAVPVTSQGWFEQTFSRHKVRHELDAWFNALLLTRNTLDARQAVGFDPPAAALVVSKDGHVFRCVIDTEATEAIDNALAYLVDLRRRSLSGVVALFAETSLPLAQQARSPANKNWFSSIPGGSMGDRTRNHIEFFFGDMTLQEMLDQPLHAQAEADRLWTHIQETTQAFGDKP